MKESPRVLGALGAAVAGGIAVAGSGDATLLRAADAIAPIGAVWVNAIRMTVIPLVVSVMVTGVASALDMKAIGRLGGRTILVFVAMPAALAALAVPLTTAVFGWLGPRGAGAPPLPAGPAEAARLLAADPQQTFSPFLVSLVPAHPV